MNNENKQAGLNKLAELINTHLATLTFEKLPEASTREKIRSVSYVARGYFEGTHQSGTECVSVENAKRWLSIK